MATIRENPIFRIVWQQTPIQECGEPMIDLSKFNFVLDPVYFKQGISNSPVCFVREQVAHKLQRVQDNLGRYRLKIWDTWRPRSLQAKLYDYYRSKLAFEHPDWDKLRLDEEMTIFVARPDINLIPPHSTGGAVDITLVDQNGKELDMGTDFDHFGPEAASLYFESQQQERSAEICSNRRLLRSAMSAEGFRFDEFEWWHFDFGNQCWAAAFGYSFAIYDEISEPLHTSI
ncbi:MULTISPECIES: M15 family metallopeptidase [Nostocales]|uniref:D-alanyl-D-alanine dipeptidase n=3 Tax=Nostocales TaxID=1161 RepID=A0A8S9TCX4_9CYAN|nr:M15 family metallopeptidase [Tolypothrix bouteillei]KAF3889299.1 M15 family metallopeptidase [Tolypothrix bouteillei VB521301]